MEKILIFGNSGSGKSTLAQELASAHDLAHLDLDTLAWLPQMPPERAPLAEAGEKIRAFITAHDDWVIEGCYTDLLELAQDEATRIIFMDIPVAQCIDNARRRPWEPHKYVSKEEQDKNLAMLIDWIAAYVDRVDVFSLRAHRHFFDAFAGPKTRYTDNERTAGQAGEITIRAAGLADAKAIAHLHASSWRRTYRGNFRDAYLDGDVFTERDQFWASRLGTPKPNQCVFVAETGETLCGFLCVFGHEDTQWGSFIDNLHVDSHFQQQGIGSRLLHQAGTWLEQHYPGKGVWLVVWEGNPAIRFYEALGGSNSGLLEEENPGGGTGKYFRMVWSSSALLLSKTRRPV